MPADSYAPVLREELRRQWADDLGALFARMAERWDDDPDTWAPQIADVVRFNGRQTAVTFGRLVVDQFVQQNSGRYWEVRFRADAMTPWIDEVADNRGDTVAHVVADMHADEDEDDPFGWLLGAGAAMYATSLVGTFANFGAKEGAEASGARQKTWQVNSGNPRSSHAALDGETVPMSENFSNGMPWPGWVGGGADEVAGCQCSLVYDL